MRHERNYYQHHKHDTVTGEMQSIDPSRRARRTRSPYGSHDSDLKRECSNITCDTRAINHRHTGGPLLGTIGRACSAPPCLGFASALGYPPRALGSRPASALGSSSRLGLTLLLASSLPRLLLASTQSPLLLASAQPRLLVRLSSSSAPPGKKSCAVREPFGKR